MECILTNCGNVFGQKHFAVCVAIDFSNRNASAEGIVSDAFCRGRKLNFGDRNTIRKGIVANRFKLTSRSKFNFYKLCAGVECISSNTCYAFGNSKLGHFITILKGVLIDFGNTRRNIELSVGITIQSLQYATILERIITDARYSCRNCNRFDEIAVIECSSRNCCLNCNRYVCDCGRDVVIITSQISTTIVTRSIICTILPNGIFFSGILSVTIRITYALIIIFVSCSYCSITKDITKHRLIVSRICTLSYKRKRNILNCVTSLECAKSNACYGFGYYYFDQLSFVFKSRSRDCCYGNTTDISRNPHRCTCSVICTNSNRRCSAIRKVGRLIFLCPVCVYRGIRVQRCSCGISCCQRLISKPTAEGITRS